LNGAYFVARDALAGVEHRVKGLARVLGKARPRWQQLPRRSQSWSRKSTVERIRNRQAAAVGMALGDPATGSLRPPG
jgi:hypothetical protein